MTTTSSLVIDPNEIIRTLNLFCGHLGRTEIRALKCRGKWGGPFTASGYFDSGKLAVDWVKYFDDMYHPSGFYFIFNDISEPLLSRYHNRFEQKPPRTTVDSEIERRRWLLVDIDPPRVPGVSATDDEKTAAVGTFMDVSIWLKDKISQPIHCDSGNGWHLYCRIDLPNDDQSTAIVSGILQKLQQTWPMVDAGNSNAARITKLFGTVARKGDATPKRPYRQSRILYVPDYLKHGWTCNESLGKTCDVGRSVADGLDSGK